LSLGVSCITVTTNLYASKKNIGWFQEMAHQVTMEAKAHDLQAKYCLG